MSIISPLQQDYVTRVQFEDLDIKVDEQFCLMERSFGEARKYVDDGFTKVFEQVDNLENQVLERFNGIDKRFDSLEGKMDRMHKDINMTLVKIQSQLEK